VGEYSHQRSSYTTRISRTENYPGVRAPSDYVGGGTRLGILVCELFSLCSYRRTVPDQPPPNSTICRPTNFGQFQLNVEEVDECLNGVHRAIELSGWLSRSALEEAEKFTEFAKWLRTGTLSLSHPSITLLNTTLGARNWAHRRTATPDIRSSGSFRLYRALFVAEFIGPVV
jgi:hypothetical protein